MRIFKYVFVPAMQIFFTILKLGDCCNFGFANLGVGNFGFGNIGIGNKGAGNVGILNTGFAQLGLRNIGALNVLPIPNTISVFNIPVGGPNLTPPIGKRRRRSTLWYPASSMEKFPWFKR